MPDLAALIDSRVWLDTNAFAEPLLRRVLNANFHFGTPDSAKALGLFAARADAPENMRAEALEELADWPHPSGLDRVVGLWRPVAATRRPETAVEALEPVMPAIFHSGKDKVRIALIRAVSRLAISNAAPNLSEILADTKATDELRIEALKALASLDSVRFERALDLAQTDPREKLRRAAITLEGQAGTPNAPGRLATTLADGSVGEKQAAFAILAGLHDPMADNILAQWMDKLNEGKVPEALQLDLIQAAAKRSDISVRQKLSQYNASRPKSDPLAEFRETLFGGDAAQGKTIFFDRPDAQCVRCHRIDGQGGDVGPDLSHIGGQKERTYLLESILFPNKQIAQGFESVLVTLKDNESYAGVLKSENAGQIVINSPNGGLLTFEKTNILSRQKALSPMPEGMDQVLSKEDLRNLVEYLFGLK